jgi:predicted amidophosphoribosyltransferase
VVFAVGGYEGALRRAIVDYKYRNERWWAGVFARLLAGYLDGHPTWFEEFDLVVGMPGYVGPGARRGWDHIALVVDHLAELEAGCWHVAPGALQKVTETEPMSGRSRWARERAAQGPLRRSLRVADPGAVEGARVLAVDDVLTEGSSLNEVSRALRLAGAAEVAGLVLARPPWHGPPGPPARAR